MEAEDCYRMRTLDRKKYLRKLKGRYRSREYRKMIEGIILDVEMCDTLRNHIMTVKKIDMPEHVEGKGISELISMLCSSYSRKADEYAKGTVMEWIVRNVTKEEICRAYDDVERAKRKLREMIENGRN